MPYSLKLVPNGASTHGTLGNNIAWVGYSSDDLNNVTKLTLAWYGKAELPGGSNSTMLFGSRGIPYEYGRRHFWVDLFDDGSSQTIKINANATSGAIDAETVSGVWTQGVPFSLIIVFDFTQATSSDKIKVYVDGSLVAWNSFSDGDDASEFYNALTQSSYVFGYEAIGAGASGTTWHDYLAAWTGTAGTALQAAEYGGPFRAIEDGSLGLPVHLFDFENALTDTGSSPFTVYDSINVEYTTEATHPVAVGCSSLTFADSVEAEDAAWTVFATIEGIGETGEIGEYDQLYRFCSTVPHFAEGSGLWLPWLAEWPEILAEGAPREDGGVVEAGELTLAIVDIEDRLTALFATEADPTTYLTDAVPIGAYPVIVEDASNISVGDILYIGSECLFVEAKTGNELNCARACLDTGFVGHDIGAPVHVNRIPYLLSRRIRLYLAPADSCDGSEAVEIGQYRIDQLELDETLGKYLVRGPSSIIFAAALCNRKAPVRFDVTQAWDNGKVSVRPKQVDQEYPSIPFWDPTEKQAYVRLGEEIAIAENISASDTWPIFQIVDRAVSGSQFDEGWQEIKSLEVAYGALPQSTGSGARPTFFRYAEGPTPASVRNGTWIPSAHWIDIILNLLTSSAATEDDLELANRVAAYGAWDCLPPGLGIGQRAAFVDFGSALSIKYRTPDYAFPNFVLPREPVTFGELITEEFLRPIGAYLITTGGQARIVMPRIPIPSDTSFTIGHSNIVSEKVGERLYGMGISVRQDMSELVSSLVYKFGRGDNAPTLTINDSDFDRTYGSEGHRESEARRRSILVPSVRPDADGGVEWIKYRGMSTLMRKRWPARTISYKTSGLSRWAADVGDVGELTHAQVPDPSTGTRGVTDLQVELRSKTVHVQPGNVSIDHVVRAERKGRYGLIAPSALIVSVAADGSSRIITVEQNYYTEPEADIAGLPVTDASAFTVGDSLELHNRAGTRDGSSSATITAISGNTITVNSDFGGALDSGTTDANKVLKLREYAFTTAEAAETFVYLADSTTRAIANVEDSAPWQYGEP